jgi:hypothetical protein
MGSGNTNQVDYGHGGNSLQVVQACRDENLDKS